MDKILTAGFDIPGRQRIEVYLNGGGYRALEKALSLSPDSVIEEVKRSGLRGRGGAGFPTGLKWGFIQRKEGVPRYLICNADEGEPGTFKDREIMRRDPHLLIEGIAIASHAIGAENAYIYIRGEFREEAEILERAITEAREKGFIGKKRRLSSSPLDLLIVRGAGAYICGEETALIESIEGKRGYPRIRPPFPATRGLFGLPTVVNNVETLSSLPYIIENGADSYRRFGTEKSPGTKLFSISGDIRAPGVYEVPLGFPLKEFIEEFGRGTKGDRPIKAVFPGGSSTPPLRGDELEGVNLDYESLQMAGSMLGSGAIIVVGEGRCMVAVLKILLRFYAHESCGQCTPCREGVPWLYKIVDAIERGAGKPSYPQLLRDICKTIMGRTICPLGDAAVLPTLGILDKFENEIAEHLQKGRCPFVETVREVAGA